MASEAHARPDDYRVNLREQCRQAVAGAYLNAFDESRRTEEYARSLVEALAKVDAALVTARAAAKQAASSAASAQFDADTAFASDQRAAELRTLEAQRADYDKLRTEAQAKLATLELAERALKAKLDPLFTIERAQDAEGGGYPVRLDYRSPCPKFRALCALPYDEALALAQLDVPGATLESCRRYASLSKAR
jgi:hypothetical protein